VIAEALDAGAICKQLQLGFRWGFV